MIVEMLFMILIFIGGYVFLYSLGIKGFAAMAMGIVVGLALQIVVGTLQIISPIPNNPYITISVFYVYPIIKAILIRKKLKIVIRDEIKSFCFYAVMMITFIIIVVFLLFEFGVWVKWHSDSLQYIFFSKMLYADAVESYHSWWFIYRMLGVPIIFIPAQITGEYYLRSVFMLLGTSTVLSLMWFIKYSVSDFVSKKKTILLMLAGGLLLITVNRFVFHLFYINGHLLVAALALMIAACGSIVMSRKNENKNAYFILMALCLSAMIVTRPESFLIVAFMIIPFIAAKDTVTINQKKLILIIYGATVAMYYGYILYLDYRDYLLAASRGYNFNLETPTLYHVLIGLTVVVIGIVLKWLYKIKIVAYIIRYMIYITEAALWIVLYYIDEKVPPRWMIHRSMTLVETIIFQRESQWQSSWGFSLLLIIVLIIIILLFIKRKSESTMLRFSLTTFLPISLLGAFMAGGYFREGYGGSFERMLIQIVPLAIYFVIHSIGTGKFRFMKQ
ncbi:MAG: hypothetical protein LBC73_10895 [Oscillospiraceae bacterium]|jgi:hypothetical protein|nr:hypothetical protein [Oscillospiraceae bacterium]